MHVDAHRVVHRGRQRGIMRGGTEVKHTFTVHPLRVQVVIHALVQGFLLGLLTDLLDLDNAAATVTASAD